MLEKYNKTNERNLSQMIMIHCKLSPGFVKKTLDI